VRKLPPLARFWREKKSREDDHLWRHGGKSEGSEAGACVEELEGGKKGGSVAIELGGK
jgi:hypothetical protein